LALFERLLQKIIDASLPLHRATAVRLLSMRHRDHLMFAPESAESLRHASADPLPTCRSSSTALADPTMKALLLLGVALIAAAPASAEDWRYCLAISPDDNKVYMSEPIQTNASMSAAADAFSRLLARLQLRIRMYNAPRAPMKNQRWRCENTQSVLIGRTGARLPTSTESLDCLLPHFSVRNSRIRVQ
jgi:hypothetical protein